jgi:hypothetical protein
MAAGDYRIDVEKAVTGLYSFNSEMRAILSTIVRDVAERVAARERAALAGHSKSGRLASSVRVTVKEYRDRIVAGYVTVGGTRRSRYGNLFERGHDGTVTVPDHERTSEFGTKFSVKAYQMRLVRPAHEYLSAALRSEAPAGRQRVLEAVDSAAKEARL